MAIAATISILVMILCIVMMVLLVLLQIYLSRKDNKWIGLILPGIHFVFSIVIMVYVCMVNMSFMSYGGTTSTVTVVAEEETEVLPNEEIDNVGVPGTDINEGTTYVEGNKHSYEAGEAEETEYLPNENATTIMTNNSNFSMNMGNILLAFLCLNIPTIVDVIIYCICRKNRKKKSNIDKMKIKDL